jgi:hypothetical protein
MLTLAEPCSRKRNLHTHLRHACQSAKRKVDHKITNMTSDAITFFPVHVIRLELTLGADVMTPSIASLEGLSARRDTS